MSRSSGYSPASLPFPLLSPPSFVVAAQCPLAFCFDDNLLSSLSIFSPSFSQNLKLLCLRLRQISCSDFNVKNYPFFNYSRTQSHTPLFRTRFASFYEKMHLHHQHYRRTCKKLVFGPTWIDGLSSALLRRRRRTQLPTTKPHSTNTLSPLQ